MGDVHHLTAVSLIAGAKPRRERKRRITLDRALRQAARADIAVSAATINADGSVTLNFGDNDQSRQQNENDWDTL
jgi:hypothetical protein